MAVENGYKLTQIGILPKEWEIVSLGDIFVFKNGLNKASHFFGKGTPIVNYMDVFKNNGLVISKITGRVTLTSQETKNFEVRKGDVFFTRTSETVEEIGISSVMLEEPEATVFSGFILRARPINQRLNLEFKKYCFSNQSIRKEIVSKSSYTTRALTNGRLLSAVKIPLPPLPEQTAIATALSDMDALIAQTSALIEKKKAIKLGVMQELLRPKEGWVKKKLGEVCELKKGQLITESTRINGEIPVIAGGKTPAYFHNKANRQGKTISISASGASAGYISFHSTPIFASDCSTISAESNFCIEFVFYWLQMNQSNIYKLQTGGAQPHIHPSDLNPLEISLPNINEQNLIAETLSTIDDELNFTQKKLQKLQLQKQGMMQALLTGKIRLV